MEELTCTSLSNVREDTMIWKDEEGDN